MTVVLTATIQSWIGLSSDSKPTSPPAGSTFYETDSGATYVYDGAAWQFLLRGGPFMVRKTVAFDGSAGNGAVGTVDIFTITGRVQVEQMALFTTENLAQAAPTATIRFGTAFNDDDFCTEQNAVELTVGEFWNGAASDPNVIMAAAAINPSPGSSLTSPWRKLLSQDPILTIGAQNVTDGTIEIACLWTPISSDGKLVAA